MCEEFELEQAVQLPLHETECQTNETDETMKLRQIALEKTVLTSIGRATMPAGIGYAGNPYMHGVTGDSYNPALGGHDF